MQPVSSARSADLFFQNVFPTLYGFILSRSIYAIAKLGVPETLRGTSLSVTDIAQKRQIKCPENLERLMNFLSSQGIFSKLENGQFTHTRMSEDLVWERSGKRIVCYHDLRWDKLATAEEASLEALNDDDEAQTQVEQLSRLFVLARAIYIACCLNVFEKIRQGQSVPNPLMKRLEQAGLASNAGLTESGRVLLDTNCKAFVMHDNADRWISLGKLEEAVKDGITPFEGYTKNNFFAYLQERPEALKIFAGAMTFISENECKQLVGSLKNILEPNMSVMDVGGGTGKYLQEILTAYPEVHGILFDLPENTNIANLDDSVKDRCSLIGGNFFEHVPAADLYLFKRVLHDWSDQDCIRILQTCAKSARPNSRLILNEFLLPQPEALMIDTYFMACFKGRQRTSDEFAKILDAAGWTVKSREKTSCWLGQIVAAKK